MASSEDAGEPPSSSPASVEPVPELPVVEQPVVEQLAIEPVVEQPRTQMHQATRPMLLGVDQPRTFGQSNPGSQRISPPELPPDPAALPDRAKSAAQHPSPLCVAQQRMILRQRAEHLAVASEALVHLLQNVDSPPTLSLLPERDRIYETKP